MIVSIQLILCVKQACRSSTEEILEWFIRQYNMQGILDQYELYR